MVKNDLNYTDLGRLRLAKPVWDDLRFPASGLNPPGAASDPDIETDSGTFLFDAGSTEVITFQVQMPHRWREGTAIEPHVHWQKTTSAAGNVLWQLRYKHAPINAVMDSEFTLLSASSVVAATPDTNTADKHLITELGSIDMSGYGISHMLVCGLLRVGGNAADTYGADARLLEVDFHYQVDTLGSEGEFSKEAR